MRAREYYLWHLKLTLLLNGECVVYFTCVIDLCLNKFQMCLALCTSTDNCIIIINYFILNYS